MDVITIGCRLPHGYVLEVGLTPPTTKNGRMVTRHVQREDYARFELKGTNARTADARKRNIPIVAMLREEPAMNRSVPVTLWERWKKEYPQTWKALSKAGSLFEAKDKTDAQAKALDVMAQPDAFAPLDPSGDARAPKNNKIEPANFKE